MIDILDDEDLSRLMPTILRQLEQANVDMVQMRLYPTRYSLTKQIPEPVTVALALLVC